MGLVGEDGKPVEPETPPPAEGEPVPDVPLIVIHRDPEKGIVFESHNASGPEVLAMLNAVSEMVRTRVAVATVQKMMTGVRPAAPNELAFARVRP